MLLRRLTALFAVLALCFALTPWIETARAVEDLCVTAGDQTTCTYAYTGAEQRFTVPAGVTRLSVSAVGGNGGSGGGGRSGGGGGSDSDSDSNDSGGGGGGGGSSYVPRAASPAWPGLRRP
ncbi:MAG: hypothetical protein WKH64_06495 [Chloroflexia bacterium]